MSRPAVPAERLCAFFVCLLTACALACGGDEQEPAEAEPIPAPLERAALADELPPLPPPGEVTLELSGETLTLLANQVPRRAVLRKLKLARDFELVLADREAAKGIVTVRVVGGTVEDALAATLAGVPFSLHYAPWNAVSIVDQVTVGDARAGKRATGPTRRGNIKEARHAKRQALRRKLAQDREERARLRAGVSEEERQREREEAGAALERGLASPDPRTRAAAVEMLDDEGFPALVDRLRNDRSPEVRAAAAQVLGGLTATRAGTSALVEALNDPDPQVVIAALDSLQWIDDPSVIPDVQEALDHPSSEVRTLAAETVDWLE